MHSPPTDIAVIAHRRNREFRKLASANANLIRSRKQHAMTRFNRQNCGSSPRYTPYPVQLCFMTEFEGDE
eukprot:scaffold11698_cov138-Cylindrotheca_fusiformis.AAC.2